MCRLAVINRGLVRQARGRDFRRDLVANLDPHHAVVGDAADGDAVQVPFLEDRLDLLFLAAGGDQEHAFLGFAEHDLIRDHAALAFRDFLQINFHAAAAAAGRFAGGTGKPGGAHVLDADHQPVMAHDFEAGFEQEFFHERVADLDRGPVRVRFFGKLARGERGPGQAVATGGAADVDDRVADAGRGAALDLVVAEDTEAEGVDQRVAVIGIVEVHLAADGRDADAIAVVRDTGDDAGEQAPVLGDRGRRVGAVT